jgi:hypothetical protein
MNRAAAYYTSYSRALLKYANNGFFARDLDADDHAFLERVRECRVLPCGSLAEPAVTACTYSDSVIRRIALAEEMEFWQQPYQIDKIVVRRHGPIARRPRRPVGSTPDALARAERRKRNEELAAAERAAELQRLEDRRREQLRRDIEWEKAAPKSPPFGKVKDRHFVPQWKVNDKLWTTSEAKLVVPPKLTSVDEERLAARKLARETAKYNGQSLTAHEADEAADRILGIEPESDRMARLAREYWAELEQKQQEQQQRASEQQQQQEKQHKQQALPSDEQDQHQIAQRMAEIGGLQMRIMAVMRNTYPRIITLEELQSLSGCQDQELLIYCADQLVRSGKLMQGSERAA